MTCASCASSAESIVKFQSGVVDASVNFATGNLTVEYLPNMINASQLKQALQSVGYDLFVEQESNQQESIEAIHAKKYELLKTKTIWAVILSIQLVVMEVFLGYALCQSDNVVVFNTCNPMVRKGLLY